MAALGVALTFGAPAPAQVREWRCPFKDRSVNWEYKMTLDHGANTMTVQTLDGGAVGSLFPPFQGVAATFGTDYIVGETRASGAWIRFTLNRYTSILQMLQDRGAGSYGHTSEPCVPFQRGKPVH